MTSDIESLPTSDRIVDRLCANLDQRCKDPNVAWPYHPRVGLGATLVDCLLNSLGASSASFAKALGDGTILVRRNTKTGGKRRSKRLDLVMCRNEPGAILVAVEAKACMTAHAKAHTRLVAELTSSLDAILDADSRAKFFSLVAINCGATFTSPLKLPGPNRHDMNDGPALAKALAQSLTNNVEICGTLFLPIRFDNEQSCEVATDVVEPHLCQDSRFLQDLVQVLEISSS